MTEPDARASTSGGPPDGLRGHHLEVVRTARYWTLGDPGTAREHWFVLHGYRQLAHRFIRRFAPIVTPERCVVAPEGLSRFYTAPGLGRHGAESPVGATWMTREDRVHEIRDYVRYLDRLAERVLPEAGADTVVVLGFSQGVATAARWTTMGTLRANRLLLWGDFLPPDLDLDAARAAWARCEVLLVRGDADPALQEPELERSERERIDGAGLRVTHVSYGGRHEIDVPTLRRLAEATGPSDEPAPQSGSPPNDT